MNENEISKLVVDTAIAVHRELGPGLFESVYETVLASELAGLGLDIECQVDIPVEYKGRRLAAGFRADIVVNSKVILELKSARISQIASEPEAVNSV